MLFNTALHAQFGKDGTDRLFLSVGVDLAIASGTNLLAKDNKRVGTGSLDLMIHLGMENYTENKIQFKFQAHYESFKKINYSAYGFYGGITFDALTVPFTGKELAFGHFWYVQLGVDIISRKGLDVPSIYNSDSFEPWAIGGNFGVVIQKPVIPFVKIKLPFDVELLSNFKDRPDLRAFYTKKPVNLQDMKFSFYVMIKHVF